MLINFQLQMCEDGTVDKRLVVIDNISRELKFDYLIDSRTDLIIDLLTLQQWAVSRALYSKPYNSI